MSALEAITAALTRLVVSRIVVLTPYSDEVAAAEAGIFRLRGVAVTGYASPGRDDGYDTITSEQVKS